MNRWLAITGGLLAFLLGFVFLRGPTPHIAISAETLTTLGPVGITNTMITSWLIVALIVVSIVFATRKWELVPSGIQNLFEAALEGFYNIVTGIAGDENGRRFFPFVATIFFFILVSNWLSLTPLFNVVGWVGHDTPAAEQIYLQLPPLVIEPCDATHACTAQQFSAFNLKSWQLEVALRLPGGQGVVCKDASPFDGSVKRMKCDGGDLVVVKVFWQKGAHQESSSARVVKIAG